MSQEEFDILIAMLISSATFIFLIGIMVAMSYKFMKRNQLQKDILFRSILETQELEKNRISRDIHDGLGGLLSGTKIRLSEIINHPILNEESLESIKVAYDLVKRAETEARNASLALTPETIVISGMKVALDELFIDFSQYFTMDIENEFPEGISNHFEIQLYRIFQELLNNALKYSRATKIIISIMSVGKDLEILFWDNGIGMDLEKLNYQGNGIKNIKLRTQFLCGKIKIKNDNGLQFHFKFDLLKLK
jgi:signal transduction histidine kinase